MHRKSLNKQRVTLISIFILLSVFVLLKRNGSTAVYAQTDCAADLFISEYIEGSGQNKGIELYNGTGSDVDLTTYRVELYSNGNITAQSNFPLDGMLPAGETLVIVTTQTPIEAELEAAADRFDPVILFNGDDTILLHNNDVVIDSFGQLGVDPGTAWSNGDVSTKDMTLVRLPSVSAGDTTPDDPFDPSLEWTAHPQDTFSFLGAHTLDCAAGTPIPSTPPSSIATEMPSVPATVVPTQQPVSAVDCDSPTTPIHAVQGAADQSPLSGSIVVLKGVVTGDYQADDQLDGFFMQEEDADADNDPNTSEGLLIYDDAFGVDVQVGDVVVVRGTATEFNDLTEVNSVTEVVVCGNGAAVTPTTLTFPLTDAQLEATEGMAVQMGETAYVTELYGFGQYGQIAIANERLYNPTQVQLPGVDAIDVLTQNNLNRLVLDDGSTAQNPDVIPFIDWTADGVIRGGDALDGVTGVLNYAFGEYQLLPTAPFNVTADTPRQTMPDDVNGEITVATFNVLNYFTTIDTGDAICAPTNNADCRGADSIQEFNRQRNKIIAALAALSADVVGLIEIENNQSESLQDLVDGVNGVLGAGTYDYIDTGFIGDDAIKVGFIYKPATITPVGQFAILDGSVDPDFIDDKNRPTLAQTFSDRDGELFTAAINHFKSKGSDCNGLGDPDEGDGQGNCNKTRTMAATAMADWLATDPTASGDPDFLILGDLNAYAMEDPIMALKAAGYDDLAEIHVGPDRYSYVFKGEYGTLDYALSTASLTTQVGGATIWHVNSDEARYLDYNDFNQEGVYAPDPYRSSDHDPVVVGLQLGDVVPTSVPTTEPTDTHVIFLPMMLIGGAGLFALAFRMAK